MAKRVQPQTTVSDSTRIQNLESTLQTFTTWAKVAFLLIGSVSALAVWLSHRASELTIQYNALDIKYSELKKTADHLTDTLPGTANDIIKQEFPKAFSEVMKDIVHTNDQIVLRNHRTQRIFGADNGTSVLTNATVRGPGPDEILDILKQP